MKRRDTEDLLRHWGMWVIQGSGVAACQASTLPTPMITDDEGLLIDGLVSRLRRGYPESADVLLYYYTSQDATFVTVGRRLGFSEGRHASYVKPVLHGLMACWRACAGQLDIRTGKLYIYSYFAVLPPYT
ncbi:antiterminator Q family protein [Azorhizophilus paspali]|uniref:antiterminator Q family protein n=1 Tax=Azorhizophilus paspali TaxID=69963 RepID=UPI0036329575